MTTIVISLLIASQVVSFYLIFKRLKPKNTKPSGILLRPLKESASYETVDTNYDLVYDVLESIKVEDWDLELEPEISGITGYGTFRHTFTSKDGKVTLRSRISEYSDGMSLSMFVIIGKDGLIRIDQYSNINNDIILFLWDYVVEYYEKKYENDKISIENAVCGIRKSLTTLRRSERLNSILND